MRFGWLGAAAAVSTLIVSVSAGCSQSAPSSTPPEEPVVTSQAIQGGMPDGTAHPFAVGVCSGNKGNCQGFCSGTLILPNLVVTARHCIDQTAKIIDCDVNPTFGARKQQMWITTHNEMAQGTIGWHHVKSFVTTNSTKVCGNDIALLVLDDQVPAAEAKPAIPGVQYPMGDLNRYQRRFAAVGYGNTGPTGFSAGTRRIRQDISVVCIPGDDIADCPAIVDVNEFIGGDGTCEGDSGSSAFEGKTFTKNAAVSFGVLSRGGDNAVDGGVPTFCKGSLYTRLDKYRDLVIQAAETASANWTLYPKPVPDWTVYVPPPVDAGTDAAPKKKTNLAEGTACDANDECRSMLCADTGAGKACTRACVETPDSTGCPAGFICSTEAICVQDLGGGGGTEGTVASAAPGTTTTEGCGISSRTPKRPLPWEALAILSSAVVLGLRRRSRR